MKHNGLISKLVMPLVFAGLLGCANNNEVGISPFADEIRRGLDYHINKTEKEATSQRVKKERKPEDEIRDNALMIYWGCSTLLVSQKKVSDYDMLRWAMAYGIGNTENEITDAKKKLIEKNMQVMRKREIKNPEGYKKCLESAKVIQGDAWKDPFYLDNWGCLNTNSMIGIGRLNEGFNFKLDGKTYLNPLGNITIDYGGKSGKRNIWFCEKASIQKMPEIPKQPLKIKTAPGKD